MTETTLENLLMRATGESRRTLRRRGFQLANPIETNYDPEPDLYPPQAFDWDARAARPLARIA